MPTVPNKQHDRQSEVKRVFLGLLIANLVVVFAKLFIGFATGSLAVAGDAVHSSVDAMNNVLGLAIISVAALAPDEDHPYGHRKFETLGALLIVVFLSITGFELIKGAMTRMFTGSPPIEISNGELSILVATLVINVAVASYETRRGKELDSQLLLADAAHTKADVFITIGVITGVFLSRSGLPLADPIVALVVAGAIVVIARDIILRTIPVLVDEQVVDYREIKRIAEEVDGVAESYDIKSRGAPNQRFAELTISVAGQATVEQAHEIADLVEDKLRHNLGIHQIVVHVEPC
jgi:cation diffusion facilitator family transporter